MQGEWGPSGDPPSCYSRSSPDLHQSCRSHDFWAYSQFRTRSAQKLVSCVGAGFAFLDHFIWGLCLGKWVLVFKNIQGKGINAQTQHYFTCNSFFDISFPFPEVFNHLTSIPVQHPVSASYEGCIAPSCDHTFRAGLNLDDFPFLTTLSSPSRSQVMPKKVKIEKYSVHCCMLMLIMTFYDDNDAGAGAGCLGWVVGAPN